MTNWRTFAGTADSAALMQPWVTTPQPLQYGIPQGYDMRTWQTWNIDPVMIKNQTTKLHSTIFHFIGEKGGGKSTALKTFTLDFLALQAGVVDGVPQPSRAWINDLVHEGEEGEFAGITSKFRRCKKLSLAKDASINIFDSGMNLSEWDMLEIAINVAETGAGHVLQNYEPLALQVAMYTMRNQFGPLSCPEVLEIILRSQDIRDLVDYYSVGDTEVLKRFADVFDERPELERQLQLRLDRPLNINQYEFRRDSARVASYFTRILRGDFGRSIGGQNSLRSILTSPMVHIDWTGLNTNAYTLIEALLWKWQSVALNNNDLDMIPHVKASDEEGIAMKNLMHARFESDYSKKGRRIRTIDLRSFQYDVDLLEAGAEGSELRALGRNIDMGVGGRFYTRQTDDPAVRERMARRGISDLDIEKLMTIGQGGFGFKLPNEPLSIFMNVVPEAIKKLVDTESANKAMATRMSVMDVPGFMGDLAVFQARQKEAMLV